MPEDMKTAANVPLGKRVGGALYFHVTTLNRLAENVRATVRLAAEKASLKGSYQYTAKALTYFAWNTRLLLIKTLALHDAFHSARSPDIRLTSRA